ncbi:MAG: hypothetical protein GY908_02225 [Flavobacteriales bacterium]|nr:hypothetical protein [Flavobacteriales bacterium]
MLTKKLIGLITPKPYGSAGKYKQIDRFTVKDILSPYHEKLPLTSAASLSEAFKYDEIPTILSSSDLGERIGGGINANVYSIRGNPFFVVKEFNQYFIENSYKEGVAEQEKILFNCVYGEGSAEMGTVDAWKALIMAKVRGKTICSLTSDEIPKNLRELVFDCIIDLRNKGIVHADMTFNNFIYDENTDRVYAIDITSMKKGLNEDVYEGYISEFMEELNRLLDYHVYFVK